MKNHVRSAAAMLLAGMMLALSGCAGSLGLRPANITDAMVAESGIVFGSLSRVDGLIGYSSYYYDLRSTQDDSLVRLRVWVDGMSPSGKPDDAVDGVLRHILASSVPPGRYEFFRMLAFATNGYIEQSVTFTFKEPRALNVEAGKAYYLAAGVVLPKIGENWLGVDEVQAIEILQLNNAEADIALARKVYPNLPPVEIVEPQPPLNFEAEKIIAIAKRMNPQEKFWSKEAWERVKAVE